MIATIIALVLLAIIALMLIIAACERSETEVHWDEIERGEAARIDAETEMAWAEREGRR